MRWARRPTAPAAQAKQLRQVIAEAEQTLDTDAKLAASIQKAGNVLLPSVYLLGEPQGKADQPLPAYVARSAIDENSGFSVPAIRGQYPIESIGNAAAGIGHLNQLNDVDGAVRDEPLLVNYYGKAVPSMALLAAAQQPEPRPRRHPAQCRRVGADRQAARARPTRRRGCCRSSTRAGTASRLLPWTRSTTC